MSEPTYEALSPAGAQEKVAEPPLDAKPLERLQGSRIGLIWTTFSNGNLLLEALGRLLAQRHPGVHVEKVAPGRELEWGDYPDKTLTELVRERGLDAAIVTAAC
jgi:hypothetical protein